MTFEEFVMSNAPGCVQGDGSHRLLQAAYRAGAEAMRESAARLVEFEYAKDHQGVLRLKQIASHIRALDAD